MNAAAGPFEVLKRIRDGEITNIIRLRMDDKLMEELNGVAPSSIDLWGFGVEKYIKGFENIGFIELSERGDITTTPFLTLFQQEMALSFTQLAPYRNSSVVCNPVFGKPTVPSQPSNIFVLMPFSDDLRPIYEDHIKPIGESLGLVATRADDFFSTKSVVSDVWDAINNADLLVADCTGRNPNVFYELGIAHTLGKPVVLIAQSEEDIPFDIQHIRTILYEFTPRGMREFEEVLSKTIQQELGL